MVDRPRATTGAAAVAGPCDFDRLCLVKLFMEIPAHHCSDGAQTLDLSERVEAAERGSGDPRAMHSRTTVSSWREVTASPYGVILTMR